MRPVSVILFGLFLSFEIARPTTVYPYQSQYAVRPQYTFGPQYAVRPQYTFGPQYAVRPQYTFGPQYAVRSYQQTYVTRPQYRLFATGPQLGTAPLYPYGQLYSGPQFVYGPLPPITTQPTTPINQCPPPTVACLVSPCLTATCPKYPQGVCKQADPCQPCGPVVFEVTTTAGMIVVPQAQCLL